MVTTFRTSELQSSEKPFYFPTESKVRIEFANTFRHWTINDWKRVL